MTEVKIFNCGIFFGGGGREEKRTEKKSLTKLHDVELGESYLSLLSLLSLS